MPKAVRRTTRTSTKLRTPYQTTETYLFEVQKQMDNLERMSSKLVDEKSDLVNQLVELKMQLNAKDNYIRKLEDQVNFLQAEIYGDLPALEVLPTTKIIPKPSKSDMCSSSEVEPEVCVPLYIDTDDTTSLSEVPDEPEFDD